MRGFVTGVALTLGALAVGCGPAKAAGGIGQALYIEDLPNVTFNSYPSAAAAAAAGPAQTAAQQAANTTAINNALASGQVLAMRACDRVEIASSLLFVSGSGIVGNVNDTCGKPSIYMPAAQFTRAENLFASRYSANAVGLAAYGQTSSPFTPLSQVTIGNLTIQSQVADNRNITAIAVRNAKDVQIFNLEIFGIPLGIGINLQSVYGNSEVKDVYIHNFYSDTVLPALTSNAPNTTGILLGSDEVNNIATDGVSIINPRVYDVETGVNFRQKNGGDQSDGINIGSSKVNAVLVAGFDIRRVAEAIDNFGTHGRFSDGYIEDSYNFGLKLVHGAQYNVYSNITMLKTGLAAITMQSQGEDTQPIIGNRFRNIVINGLDGADRWADNVTAGVLITYGSGSASTVQPRDNEIDGLLLRMGDTGKYGWLDTSYGDRNFGRNISIGNGAATQYTVLILNDSGNVQLSGSTAFQTNLPIGASYPPPPYNVVVPVGSSFQPTLSQDFIAAIPPNGGQVITLPPGWAGTISDRNGLATTKNITVRPIPPTTFTGSISSKTLTVTAIVSSLASYGKLAPGQTILGAAAGTYIVRQVTGIKGGLGTYEVSVLQSLGSGSLTAGGESPIIYNGGAVGSFDITAGYGSVSLMYRGRTDGWLAR